MLTSLNTAVLRYRIAGGRFVSRAEANVSSSAIPV
jgi:hypothetical protein